MEAMEAILSRRSIRKYISQSVPDELIRQILEAAMSAPSAGNEQPWQFVVIRVRSILDQIISIHPHSQMLKEVTVVILVCGDMTLERHEGYWVQDCAAATENILIAAQAKGLGAVWLGVYPREDRVNGLQRLLKMPNHIVPFSLIPIGFPAEHKIRVNRYDFKRIHYNRWENFMYRDEI